MGAKSEGLKELAADLQKAADEVEERGKRIVGQGCLNIKRTPSGPSAPRPTGATCRTTRGRSATT
jgi:hypothetical protein